MRIQVIQSCGARELEDEQVGSETNENWLAAGEKRRAGYVEDNEKKITAKEERGECVRPSMHRVGLRLGLLHHEMDGSRITRVSDSLCETRFPVSNKLRS